MIDTRWLASFVLVSLVACSGGGGNTGGSGGSGSDAVCGNGKVEGGEECDGAAVPKTCAEIDPTRETGTPSCDASCHLDASGCAHTEVLTDGTLTGGACSSTSFFSGATTKAALAAEAFTPPSYPFVARKIRYTLKGGLISVNPDTLLCDSGRAHELRVTVISGGLPEATPLNEVVIPVAAGTGDGMSDRALEATLPSEIRLEAGQQIVVAVKLGANTFSGGGWAMTCLVGCKGGAFSDTQTAGFWSDKATVPYAFMDAGDDRYAIEIDGAFVDKP